MSDEMDEIWQLFADEGGQSLDTVEEILLFLKENPTDQADIAGLFRAMHTFKGNSRVLGLAVIEFGRTWGRTSSASCATTASSWDRNCWSFF